MTNPYEVLRLSSNVSNSLIRDAYNSLRSRAQNSDQIKQLDAAYAVLGNPAKRDEYDQGLKAEEAASMEKKFAVIRADAAKREEVANSLRNNASKTYKDILFPYLQTNIGINLSNPSKLEVCKLVNIQNDFFSISIKSKGLITHIPYNQVLRIIASEDDGFINDGRFFGVQAKLFIEIFHMVIYKGAIGMGFSVPFPIGDHNN